MRTATAAPAITAVFVAAGIRSHVLASGRLSGDGILVSGARVRFARLGVGDQMTILPDDVTRLEAS